MRYFGDYAVPEHDRRAETQAAKCQSAEECVDDHRYSCSQCIFCTKNAASYDRYIND